MLSKSIEIQEHQSTWITGLSEAININNPFSTSWFEDFPPIEPLPLCTEALQYVATNTDDETSFTGKGVSSSKLLKMLQKTCHLIAQPDKVIQVRADRNIKGTNYSYSLRKRSCLAIAHSAARATFPKHLKVSLMHGGDRSPSSKALMHIKIKK